MARNRIPIFAVLIAVFNLLSSLGVNLLSSQLASSPDTFQVGLVAFTILPAIVLVGIVLYWARRDAAAIVVRPTTITLSHRREEDAYAHRGLIVLTSLWAPPGQRPRAGVPSNPEQIEAHLRPARELDYASLDFEHSNLAVVIRAVTSNKTRLEHCWFVCTESKDGRPENSSATYVPALISFLRKEKGMTACDFHATDATSVQFMGTDGEIAIKTRDVIARIFAEAKRDHGLTDKDIVSDFSGCPRSMVTGLIWACLDGKRDIEFVATDYDDRGKPIGVLAPTIYSFQLQIEE